MTRHRADSRRIVLAVRRRRSEVRVSGECSCYREGLEHAHWGTDARVAQPVNQSRKEMIGIDPSRTGRSEQKHASGLRASFSQVHGDSG